jgi:hypothetical protein
MGHCQERTKPVSRRDRFEGGVVEWGTVRNERSLNHFAIDSKAELLNGALSGTNEACLTSR